MLDAVQTKPNSSDLWLSKWKVCQVNLLWPHPHMFYRLETGISSWFWNPTSPYLDMWLGPEVDDDWSTSAVMLIQKVEPLSKRKTLVV